MLYSVALNSDLVVLNIVFLFFQVSEVTSHPLYHVESKVSEAEFQEAKLHTHTHTYVRTYVHTYIHTHIYIHTYTHIHTYIHTHV